MRGTFVIMPNANGITIQVEEGCVLKDVEVRASSKNCQHKFYGLYCMMNKNAYNRAAWLFFSRGDDVNTSVYDMTFS